MAALPLPASLAGVSVKIRDHAGIERAAAVMSVAPGQVSFLVPASISPGRAMITVVDASGARFFGSTTVVPVAPALFSIGSAAAGFLAVDNQVRPLYDCLASSCRLTQIDPVSGPVTLVLYGTGFRNATSAHLSIGGLNSTTQHISPQSEWPGLDVISAIIPAALKGRGEISVELTADGMASNSVRIHVR
jgi:uncharacterized protein (TIGR03437 family)